MALSRVVSEIFNVKKCHDLEIRVRGHSGSSGPTRVNPPPMISYGPISYRFLDKRRFQSKIPHPPRVFCAPAKGVPLGIGYQRSASKTRMMGFRAEKEV